jgi:hypothetical protein
MTPGLKRLPARFYRCDSGREPVREWLKGLEPEDRKAIGYINKTQKTPQHGRNSQPPLAGGWEFSTGVDIAAASALHLPAPRR